MNCFLGLFWLDGVHARFILPKSLNSKQTPSELEFPVEIGLGSFKLNAHLLFETLGYFLGFRLFLRLRKKQTDQIPEQNRVWIIIGAAAGALIFSRLIGALEDPYSWWNSEHFWLHLYASKTIVGGLLGGLLGVEVMKKVIGEKTSSGDLFTYPLIFAMMLGRVGCFSMGVHEPTFGIPSELPWAMDLGDGILRHPTALYELLFLGALGGLLLLIEKKWQFKNGIRFQFFMIAYLIFRFLVNFIKPDVITFSGLATIQIVCLLGLAYYSRTLYKLSFTPSKLLVDGE